MDALKTSNDDIPGTEKSPPSCHESAQNLYQKTNLVSDENSLEDAHLKKKTFNLSTCFFFSTILAKGRNNIETFEKQAASLSKKPWYIDIFDTPQES